MPTTNLLTTYNSTFNYNPSTFKLYQPQIKQLLSYFAKTKPTTITIFDCFHYSLTFFQNNHPIEICKLISFYTYYITQNHPDLIQY